MTDFLQDYNTIRGGGFGYYQQARGVFELYGSEAVQFFGGLITNDVAKLADGETMTAALPTLKGRMFAVVRLFRSGEKYLIETEAATRQKVYDNLFRFTFAGDFNLEDVSDQYRLCSIFGTVDATEVDMANAIRFGNDYLVRLAGVEEFTKALESAVVISDELFEVLRIENGLPRYGIDMDEETVVPEVGIEDLISYQKGCYIGQEVIARIHFKGKVAKQHSGLAFENNEASVAAGDEILSRDDKNAGKITSVVVSPGLGKTIALAFVRNAYLEPGTELKVGESIAKVTELPFIG